MKQPVLVTGGAGYVGSHVVLALQDAGWPVAVLDSLVTGFRWAVPEGVPFYQGDTSDKELLVRIFQDQGIGGGTGAVIHSAGITNGVDSLIHPLAYYHANTALSCALLGVMVEAQVPHIIFSSTAAVYGMPQANGAAQHLPVNEDWLTAPASPFGMSKRMVEIMLADTARAHPINYGALRYFNVAGADPEGRGGQSAEGAPHLIKVAVEAALGKRPYVAIFGTDFPTPDGTAVRDYIHVSDLAAAHVLALEALMDNHCLSHVLNCGYGRGFSVLEVLDAVERATGRRIERRLEDRRPGSPDSLVADNARIMASLPWQPCHDDLDVIVRHAVAWERRITQIRGT